MTACKFIHRTVSHTQFPWSINGPTSVQTTCETHGFVFPEAHSFTEATANACPLGRIEQATEDALRRIEKALEGKAVS